MVSLIGSKCNNNRGVYLARMAKNAINNGTIDER
jgi:hypothetical protein